MILFASSLTSYCTVNVNAGVPGMFVIGSIAVIMAFKPTVVVTAVASPVLSMLTTAGFEEIQVTDDVKSSVDGAPFIR